jgi:hypothetical protein
MKKIAILAASAALLMGLAACDNRPVYDDDDDRRPGIEREYDEDRYEDEDDD